MSAGRDITFLNLSYRLWPYGVSVYPVSFYDCDCGKVVAAKVGVNAKIQAEVPAEVTS